jgi:lysozyme
MKTGSRGLALIKQFEGLRLDAYQDSVGVWTIGYGHTAAAGPPKPRRGMRISRAEADAILARDLGKYETAVENCIHRPMEPNQFDAMVSLCFNIGLGAFAKSRLVRLFNAGDEDGAARAFLSWTRAGTQRLSGLRRRREAEKRLFESKTAPAKWAVAGAGGAAAGGGLAATFGQAAVESLGYSVGNLMTIEALAVIAVVAGAVAVAALAFMGHDRRERLWNRLFGGWLS